MPMLLILLLFISMYVVILFESYETNMRLYEQLEIKTEGQIHSFYKENNMKNLP